MEKIRYNNELLYPILNAINNMVEGKLSIF